jgi:MerR family transcriptional regulator, redox-sensitive transcriptional activator SoxR
VEKEFLSVGEIAERSGLRVSAIHFYESKGFIKSHRNKGNQRRFHRKTLRTLGFLKVAQTVGLSLEEIQNALGKVMSDDISPKDFQKIGKIWEETLNAKIQLLEKMKSQLGQCIGCGCLSLKDCPLRNPDDVLSLEGTGPRLLIED